jgi:hypothetical protein
LLVYWLADRLQRLFVGGKKNRKQKTKEKEEEVEK